MENRERDRMSQRTSSTEAGDLNRKVSSEKGREHSGSGTEFGQDIGRSEHLNEGGSMENRDRDKNKNQSTSNLENESSRRSGQGEFGSSTGRSGSVGNMGGGGSEISRDESLNRDSDSDSSSRSSSWDKESGRH